MARYHGKGGVIIGCGVGSKCVDGCHVFIGDSQRCECGKEALSDWEIAEWPRSSMVQDVSGSVFQSED